MAEESSQNSKKSLGQFLEDEGSVSMPKEEFLARVQTAADVMRSLLEKIPEVDFSEPEVLVPELFICPHSGVIMTDPVTISSGHTFDKSTIQNLLEEGLKICPLSKETLADSSWKPNNLLREMIRDWCKKNKRYVQSFDYSSSTPLDLKQGYFRSLHKKLLSKSPEDQNEAAEELLQAVTYKSYFRDLYEEDKFDGIAYILATLSKSDLNSKIGPQIQRNLITILMIISAKEKVQRVIAESPQGIDVLIDALSLEDVETQRSAALIILQLSTTDLNGAILGKKEYIVELVRLFLLETNPLSYKKVNDNGCLDLLLEILANLCKIEDCINQIENFGCSNLLRVIRQSLSDKDKENAIEILSSVMKKDGSKWMEEVAIEEVSFETILKVIRNGNPRAKAKAKEIKDVLRPFHLKQSSAAT